MELQGERSWGCYTAELGREERNGEACYITVSDLHDLATSLDTPVNQ